MKHCNVAFSRPNDSNIAINCEVNKVPLISVIIPVYNKIATLSDSLECLYQQTFRNFEIIVVDDGSTDGSLELLQCHEKAGRLRLFQRATPGLGGYAARNHGVEQSRATWLVFFDADDLLLFDHLSCFGERIARYPEVELFINAYQKMVDHRRFPREEHIQEGVLERYDALAVFAHYDFIHMNGACIRRDRFKALGGFPIECGRREGDFYFWLKALCALEKIHYDNTVTSLCQLNYSAGTSDRYDLAHVKLGAEVLSECEVKLPWRERRQLRAAINRRLISWAAEKKLLGQSVMRDLLSALKWGSLLPRHWFHVAMLMMPTSYYKKKRIWIN